MQFTPVAGKARKIHETVEEFGRHFGVEQNLRILRLAVDREEADDLLFVQRKGFEFQRDGQRFVEIELAQIVEVADVFAARALEFHGKRGVLPFARDMRKRGDRVDGKFGLRLAGPFDEFRQTLAAKSAVIGGGLLFAPFFPGEIESSGVKNERDGMFTELFSGGRTAAADGGGRLTRPHPAVDASVVQMKMATEPPVAVAPGSGEAAVFQQPLGRLEFGRAGDLLQSFLKALLHRLSNSPACI